MASRIGREGLRRDLIVLGGSAGSLAVFRTILSELPRDFPAALVCVQHLSPAGRSAAESLSGNVPIEVVSARDGMVLERGTAYFAPADRHVLVTPDGLRIVYGPRENNVRPSIDVLFRSAAVAYRSRVIAVLVSGSQSDGVLGLVAVKRCGGVTIVQEPSEASHGELPDQALTKAEIDYVVPAAEIAALLVRLCSSEATPNVVVPDELRVDALSAAAAMATSSPLGPKNGEATHLTCPECDGPIWRLHTPGAAEYRCDVGHGFTAEAMLRGQSRSLERALWVAFRTLKERALLIEQMAQGMRARGLEPSARSFEARRKELDEHAATIHRVLSAGWQGGPELREPENIAQREADVDSPEEE